MMQPARILLADPHSPLPPVSVLNSCRTALRLLAPIRLFGSMSGQVTQRIVQSGQNDSGLSDVEFAKRLASYTAVDENVKTNQVVGVGSGSTIVYVAERLGQRVKEEGLQIICIPTSYQSRELIVSNGLVLGDLSRNPKIDVALDGADEISPGLNCIKGGGGCQVQEKVVAASASTFILVADERKMSPKLGTTWTKGIPLDVVPFALQPVMEKLKSLGGTPVMRTSTAKAGPTLSDNGNFIVDVSFGAITDERAAELATTLKMVTGIVDHGLFLNMASKAYLGRANGTVEIHEKA